MRPNYDAKRARKSIAKASIQAQKELEQALAELRCGGADAHIAFGHTAAALVSLGELGTAQDFINAMRVSGRAV